MTVGKDTIRLEDFLKMKTIQDFQEEVIAVKLAAQAGRDALKKEIKPKP